MFRKDSKKPPLVHVNFLMDDGGLGDMIARLPALKYIQDNYKHVVIHAWFPDYALDLAKHLLPNIIIKPFSKGVKEYNNKMLGRKTQCNQHSTMGTHLVDNAFHVLVDKQVEDEHKNYLPLRLDEIDITKFNLPEKYVTITAGFTAPVREFLPEYVNEVVKYIKSKGYEVVFLGNEVSKLGVNKLDGGKQADVIGNFKKEVDYSQGINLVNSTTLLECGKIIAQSKCFVGLDCGLAHLAGCSDVPIVVAYTTVKSRHRLPYRKDILGWNCYPIEPPESLACRGCQSNWEFVYDLDYRKCFYVEQKLDKEIQCIKSITPQMYIEQLEKIL